MDTPYFSRRLLRAKFCNSREDEKEEKKKKSKICWKNIVLSKIHKQFTVVLIQFLIVENTVSDC